MYQWKRRRTGGGPGDKGVRRVASVSFPGAGPRSGVPVAACATTEVTHAPLLPKLLAPLDQFDQLDQGEPMSGRSRVRELLPLREAAAVVEGEHRLDQKGFGSRPESRSNGVPTGGDGALADLTGSLMAVVGNWMEPNPVVIRLFGDVRTTTAEVTEVQVHV